MTPTKRRAYAALAASTALLTLAACGSDGDTNADNPPAATPATSSAPADGAEPTDSADASAAFTAGDYEATGTYTSPDGQTQSIEVEVELAADGTIVELDTDGQAQGGNSAQFQSKFESGIDALVEGRKITELDIDKVSGSSLTSGGFNDAIDQIIGQAQA